MGSKRIWQVRAVAFQATCIVASFSTTASASDEQEAEVPAAALLVPDSRYSAVVGIANEDRDYFCVGTLVAPNWVLTMGYCVQNQRPESLRILYGSSSLKKAEMAVPTRIVMEPDVASDTQPNGLALIELPESVRLASLALAPRAPEPGRTAAAVVAGWGSLTDKAREFNSDRQYHLTVTVVERAECNTPQSYDGQVTEGMMCAQSEAPGYDVCKGFGGAPLLTPGPDGRFQLVALVSWGEGCALKEKPTVYSNVLDRRQWIESVTEAAARPQGEAGTAALPQRGRILRASYDVIGQLEEAPQARTTAPDANVATRGAYRFMVSLGIADKPPPEGHFCGGVLIAPEWVITAAHCVFDYKDRPSDIRLKLDSNELAEPSIFSAATKIVPHPKYHVTPYGNYRHDVALVRIQADLPTDLRSPKLMDDSIEGELLGNKKTASVVGWGMEAFSKYASISNYLHHTTVTLVSLDDCNSGSSYEGLVDETQICAGLKGADSCQGDSGGPLLVWDDRYAYVVLGLVSWGKGCGIKKFPGVYSKLSPYRDWIEKTMSEAQATVIAIRGE